MIFSGPYPADLVPPPALVYGMKRMRAAASGSALVVQKQGSSGSATIGFNGDEFNSVGLYSFLSGEAYGRVIQWNDQSDNAKHAVVGTPAPPRIQATADQGLVIGSTPALSFQGGSNSGAVFGLVASGLTSLGLSPRDYTIVMVLRPTSSAFRNQAFTPGLANGTYVSLEAGAPISITGDTSIGSAIISNVPSTVGISAGMIIQSPNPGPFVDPVVVSSTTVNSITVFGATASTMTTGGALVVASPLVQVYANGGNNPGSISVTDNGTFSLTPNDAPLETGPSVVAITSDSTGVKVWQNEIVRSTASRSALTTTPDRLYIGQYGGSIEGSGYSRSGDFRMAALMVWNVALTQAERARVAASLYQVYGIPEAPTRSRPSSMLVVSVGDSIGSGYVAGSNGHFGTDISLGGLNSHEHRLGDMFPQVRFMNFSVPGIQAAAAPGVPAYAYIEGMMPTIVSPTLRLSKTKSLLLVYSAGGNDMVSSTVTTPVTFDTTTNRVGWTAHGLPVGARVKFSVNGDVLPTPLSFYPNSYVAVYFVRAVPNVDEFTLALTPGGAEIDLGGSPSGTHLAIGLPKTSAGIYASLLSIVSQGLAAGATKVFVCTLPPRVGGEYLHILDDLNALILAGGGGAGGNPVYTALDIGATAGFHPHPLVPNTFELGLDFWDSGHMNNMGLRDAAEAQAPYIAAELP